MPPVNKMRTYRPSSNINNSVDAFNTLLAKNMTKRLVDKKKKKRIFVKQLPARVESMLADESLQVSTEDTFDKLRLGVTSKPAKQKKSVSFKISNSEDSNQSDSRSINKSKSKSIKNDLNFSPPMTRQRFSNSTSIQKSNKSESFLRRFQDPTETILDSLEIEVESKKQQESVSYLKIPQSVPDISKTETSYNNVFNSSFRNKPTIHCSTPLISAAKKRVQTLCPIKDLSSLFKQSFEEIKKWDNKFPSENKSRENISHKTKSNSNDSQWSPEFINLRKRKVPRCSKGDSDIENARMRGLTTSLEQFNAFENSTNIHTKNVSQPSHNSYNLKEFENFSAKNYEHSVYNKNTPFNFITTRRDDRRFTDSSICLIKPKIMRKRCLSLNESSTYITELPQHCRKRIRNVSTSYIEVDKKLSIQIKRLPIIEQRLKSYEISQNSQPLEEEEEDCMIVNVEEPKYETLIVKLEKKFEDFFMEHSPFVEPQTSCHSLLSQDAESNPLANCIKVTNRNVDDFICSEKSTTHNSIKQNLVVNITNRDIEDYFVPNQGTLDEISQANISDIILGNSNESDVNKSSLLKDTISDHSSGNDNVEINRLMNCIVNVTNKNFDDLICSKKSTTLNSIKENLIVNITNRNMKDQSAANQDTLNETSKANTDELKSDNSKESGINESSLLKDTTSDHSLDYDDSEINSLANLVNITNRHSESLSSFQKSACNNDNDNLTSSHIAYSYNQEISQVKISEESNITYTNNKHKDTNKDYSNKSLSICNKNVSKNCINSPDIFGSSSNKLTETEFDEVVNVTDKSLYKDKETNIISQTNTETDKNLQETNNTAQKPVNNTAIVDVSDIIESSIIIDLTESDDECRGFKVPKPKKTYMLKPGKLWRRSFLNIRKSNLFNQLIHDEVDKSSFKKGLDACDFSKHIARKSQLLRRSSIRFVPIKPLNVLKTEDETTLLEEYAKKSASYVSHPIQQKILENSFKNLSLSLEEDTTNLENPLPVSAKEVVFRKCGQVEPLTFQKCYPESVLQHCHKVGEGVYGEVFLFKNPGGGTSVIKIIPIEGNQIVNGERQKKYDEILSEIVIATELSNLRLKVDNSTTTFNEVQQIRCVQGSYPKRLLDLWDLYDETQKSENDCPEMFDDDQLYMVLQLSHGGKDLESYLFNNAMQAYTMFEQVAFALAVAENQLNFEHRDLHWGNILIMTVEKNKVINYVLNGKSYNIPTRGVEASIIDFTLSRIEHEGVILYNDLSMDDELFTGLGDYQFDIYKLMQEKNGNNWQHYEPFTNLLWLHYVLEKAVSALRYKNTHTKIHKEYTAKLKLISNEILKYKSATDFVLNYLV